jgi:putative transposase
MISTPDRHQAVTLIAAARTEGARLEPACAVVGITVRTHQRWTREGGVREDQRPLADRATPANALSAEETQAILEACHRPDHASLPPDQIVVRLLDQEALYLGSVSTFYRVLRRHGEVTHRGRAKTPQRQARPTTYHAGAPNRLWSWDCERHEALSDRATVQDRRDPAVAAAGAKLRAARTGERQQGW